MKRLFGIMCLAASFIAPAAVQAEDFPTRPITIIAGFNAGGTSDMVLRAMAPLFEKEIGQPVLIVNRGGSGGALAIGDMLTKPADGYTICLTNTSPLACDVQLRKARYSMEDFAYLGSCGMPQESCYSLANKPWKDFQSMIAWAKKEKKPLTFSSPATFDTFMLKSIAAKEGVEIRKVPVKSGGEALTQVLGGHVDFGYGGGIQTPYVRNGQMINLNSACVGPLYHFPEVKSWLQMGYENCGYDMHYVFYVKKDTPKDVCEKLIAAFWKVNNSEQMQDAIANKAGLGPRILKADEIMPILKKQYEDFKVIAQYK